MTETQFLLQEKPVKALIQIVEQEETYSSQLHDEIETTYSHTVKIIQKMQEFGMVETEKSGRKKLIRPTEKGETLGKHLQNVFKEVEEQND